MRKFGSFRFIVEMWDSIRDYAFYNKTLVETAFLAIYALEQLLLVYFLNKTGSMVVVSYFSIIVISTFSIHKIFMESRMKIMENEINKLKSDNEFSKRKLEAAIDKYKNAKFILSNKLKEL